MTRNANNSNSRPSRREAREQRAAERRAKAAARRDRRMDTDAPGAALREPHDAYPDQSRRVIYVASEGGRTEPDYLDLLNEAYRRRPGKQEFHLHYCHPGHPNGLRPSQVVDQVLAEAEPDDEKWALFDRDAADNRDTDIPQAMRKAHREGVQVALSHPSFELWLLLHFQQWTSQENGLDGDVKNRLRRHPDAEGFSDYDSASGERGKRLTGARARSLLKDNRPHTAVRNARKLVDACPYDQCRARDADLSPIDGAEPETYEQWTRRTGHAEGCDPLKRDPSSDVWRLLASLDIGTGRN